MLLAFPRGPGGFRELRGAGRNHFHLSWCLSEAMITRYDQNNSFLTVYGTNLYTRRLPGPSPGFYKVCTLIFFPMYNIYMGKPTGNLPEQKLIDPYARPICNHPVSYCLLLLPMNNTRNFSCVPYVLDLMSWWSCPTLKL